MTKTSKGIIAELNEKHAVLMLGGKALIFSWEPSPINPSKDVPAFAAVAAMRTFYSNQYVTVKVGESTQRKPAFAVWMGRPDRPTAIGVTVDPAGGRFANGALNLWRGFDVEPRKGDWSLLRAHILDVVCDGNKAHARWLVRWIAWKLQNPIGLPEVAVVLVGLKGVGKGTLVNLLLRIFGFHGLHISNRKHLVGNFNKHLMNCLFVNPDEAVWGGDRDGEGNLKRLITEPTMFVEPKGVDGFEMPNMLAFMMTANPGWTVPASDDERRYAVFGVSGKRRGDRDYFKALRHENDNGGVEAFLHDLLAMDLGEWHPRDDVPETQALGEQKEESADKLVHWLGGILTEGALPSGVRDPATGQVELIRHPSKPNLGRCQLLYKHAVASGSRHLTEPKFYRAIKEYGIITDSAARQNQGSFKAFPPLAEARARFLEMHSWWPPFEGEGDQWRFPPRRYTGDNLLLHDEDEPAAE